MSGEISTTEGSSSFCAFPLGKGETLPINRQCSHILKSTLPPFKHLSLPLSVQSSDLSAFNEGLWDCGKHDSICLFHFKAVSVHFRLRFSQAVSPSLVAVLTRFLQIRCSWQHQGQEKHSLSSYLHKKGCSL